MIELFIQLDLTGTRVMGGYRVGPASFGVTYFVFKWRSCCTQKDSLRQFDC